MCARDRDDDRERDDTSAAVVAPVLGDVRKNKAFQVLCAHCKQHFHMTRAVVSTDDGEGEVVVHCLYCAKPVMVKIERGVIDKDQLVRTVRSRPLEEE